MQAYRCDRCKRFYDAPPEKLNVITIDDADNIKVWDLCPRCRTEFERWTQMIPLRGRSKPTTVKPELDPQLNGGFVFGE